MQLADITRILEDKKRGTFFTLTTRRPAKTFKGTTQVVEKQSTFQAILAEYGGMKSVREAVAEGERDAPELPSYVKEVFKVGGVKFWRGHNGQIYLPLPVNGNPPKVQWFLDGAEADKNDVAALLLASEKATMPTKAELAEKGQAPFVSVNIENIIEIK